MFLHVEQFEYKEDYILIIKFTDGVIKEVDLSGELHGEIFEPLKDKKYFKKAFLNEEIKNIEWPNGADFAPEYLYEKGKKIKISA